MASTKMEVEELEDDLTEEELQLQRDLNDVLLMEFMINDPYGFEREFEKSGLTIHVDPDEAAKWFSDLRAEVELKGKALLPEPSLGMSATMQTPGGPGISSTPAVLPDPFGASLTARSNEGELPRVAHPEGDWAANEAIKQLIRAAEIRRRDHGFGRAVLPNPTAAERANGYLACLEGEEEGQGQAREEHEVAYLKSLKRQRTK